jgi:hypothetical protein
MDLKYNFGKVYWCFCKIMASKDFSEFLELFSIEKLVK